MRFIFLIFSSLMTMTVFGQDAHILGHVSDEQGECMRYVTVKLKGTSIGTISDETGHYFLKDIPIGQQTVVFSYMGYITEERTVNLKKDQMLELNVKMREESFLVENVVVTANKYQTKSKEASSIVNVISPVLFEMTNAHSMADVLNYQTGLRVEQTCSNCGLPQLRINGLEGQYSQILMDSRPIFSSLTSVYGLEQIPAGMVDRVEIIRGGGSALYGANAIGGVVNIITKEPTRNFVNVQHNSSLVGKDSYDINTAFNASVITDNSNMGLFVFGVQRNRKQYDHNGDGFSNIPLLNSTTAGLRSFFKTSDYAKITAEYHHVGEYRRGGCDIDLPAHETDLAEQLRHNIDAGSLRWDYYSPDDRHYLSLYSSLQHIGRESYFGTNKNLDAYGSTQDFTAVGGTQYRYSYPFVKELKGDISAGLEYTFNHLHDRILGYGRDMRQDVKIAGGYLQNEWKNQQISILMGARIEKHNMLHNVVLSPRANIRYTPVEDMIFRVSYASGYRAPQAYDEDLHVGAVGGEVSLISIDPNLKPEYSHSISGSADLYHHFGKWDTNLTIEGFYTRLNDVFALTENGHDEKGNLLLTRVNSAGAYVGGINIEGKVGYRKTFMLQGGVTLQRSRYLADFTWSNNPNIKPQRRMFRTPDKYGYFLVRYSPIHPLSFTVDGKVTGDMLVQHMAGYIAEDEEIQSESFFEMGAKISYEVHLYKHYTLEFSTGVKNMFNQYQTDLDRGMDKDAGYIYGPALPRTFYLGFNLKI